MISQELAAELADIAALPVQRRKAISGGIEILKNKSH